jgi:hypothetical protein
MMLNKQLPGNSLYLHKIPLDLLLSNFLEIVLRYHADEELAVGTSLLEFDVVYLFWVRS